MAIWPFTRPVVENDLPTIKTLNTTSYTQSTISPNLFVENLNYNAYVDTNGNLQDFNASMNPFIYSMILYFNNYFSEQFKLDGDLKELNTFQFFKNLFINGSTVLFEMKYGDKSKLYTSGWTGSEYNLYGEVIRATPINSASLGSKLKLKNSVIYLNTLRLSPLYAIWTDIALLWDTYKRIQNNIKNNTEVLAVEGGPEAEEAINAFEAKLQNGSRIININSHLMSNTMLKGGASPEKSFMTFTDRTELLWQNFYNILELIKLKMSIPSNPSPDKKERQIKDEVNINNAWAESINQYWFESIQYYLEKFNEETGNNITITSKQEEQKEEQKENEEKQMEMEKQNVKNV